MGANNHLTVRPEGNDTKSKAQQLQFDLNLLDSVKETTDAPAPLNQIEFRTDYTEVVYGEVPPEVMEVLAEHDAHLEVQDRNTFVATIC